MGEIEFEDPVRSRYAILKDTMLQLRPEWKEKRAEFSIRVLAWSWGSSNNDFGETTL